jgi:hypothetical protein
MDTGSPSPMIISNDSEIFLIFYAIDDFVDTTISQSDEIYDQNIYIIKFKSCIKYLFGSLSNETIHGHPYFKLGMRSYSFYELEESDLIKSLKNIDNIHRLYNENKWTDYKHYILTFHDNMFECVSKSFEIKKESSLTYNSTRNIIHDFFSDFFS